eukprot:1134171-Pelagomonas_calceolata.AAC.1
MGQGSHTRLLDGQFVPYHAKKGVPLKWGGLVCLLLWGQKGGAARVLISVPRLGKGARGSGGD